jgi:hypothetical protein
MMPVPGLSHNMIQPKHISYHLQQVQPQGQMGFPTANGSMFPMLVPILQQNDAVVVLKKKEVREERLI